MSEAEKTIMSASVEGSARISVAVIRRYAELCPDEEVVFLSLPKGDLVERKRIIGAVAELVDREDHI